jgi:hypothetical protein
MYISSVDGGGPVPPPPPPPPPPKTTPKPTTTPTTPVFGPNAPTSLFASRVAPGPVQPNPFITPLLTPSPSSLFTLPAKSNPPVKPNPQQQLPTTTDVANLDSLGQANDSARRIQTINQSADSTLAQQADVAGAQKATGVAQTNFDKQRDQLVTDVINRMPGATKQQLAQIAKTAVYGKGAAQQTAQQKFIQTVTDAMTPQEQATLNASYRQVVVAQRNLDGQKLVAGVQAAQNERIPRGAMDPQDMASFRAQQQADIAQARTQVTNWVAQGFALKATWARDDAHNAVYTDSVTSQLGTAQAAVTTARQQAMQDGQNIHNAFLRSELVNDAAAAPEAAYTKLQSQLLNPQDLKTLTALDHDVQAWTAAGNQAIDESTAAANLAKAGADQFTQPGTAATQELALAQKYMAYVQANQHVRAVTMQAAAAPDKSDQQNKLLGDLVNAQATSAQAFKNWAAYQQQLAQSQFNAADAAYQNALHPQPNDYVTLMGYKPGQAQQLTPTVPDKQLAGLSQARTAASSALTQANDVLNTANSNLAEVLKLQQSIQPKHESFWHRFLSVAGSVLECAGGIAVALACSWTGVGIAVGIAGVIAGVHGLINTAHSVSDWANNTETDAPLAALGEHFGMSRSDANKLDAGVGMVSMFADGAGLVNMFREAGLVGKLAAGASGALTLDSAQAQVRYVAFNQSNPQTLVAWTAEKAGMSETGANYLNMGVGLALSAAGGKGALTGEGLNTAKGRVSAAADGTTTTFKGAGSTVKAKASAGWDSVKSNFADGWTNTKARVGNGWTQIKATAQDGWGAARGRVGAPSTPATTTRIGGFIAGARNKTGDAWNAAKGGTPTTRPGRVVAGARGAGVWLINSPRALWNAGGGVIDGFRRRLGGGGSGRPFRAGLIPGLEVAGVGGLRGLGYLLAANGHPGFLEFINGRWATLASQQRSDGSRWAYFYWMKSMPQRVLKAAGLGDVAKVQTILDHAVQLGNLSGAPKRDIATLRRADAADPIANPEGALRKELREFAQQVTDYENSYGAAAQLGGKAKPPKLDLSGLLGETDPDTALPPGGYIKTVLNPKELQTVFPGETIADGDLLGRLQNVAADSTRMGTYSSALQAKIKLAKEGQEGIESVRAFLTRENAVEAGSSMSWNTGLGKVFKSLAMLMPLNSFVYRLTVAIPTSNLLKFIGWTGELIGNGPGAAVQLRYLLSVIRRDRFNSDKGVSDAWVQKRLTKLEGSSNRWATFHGVLGGAGDGVSWALNKLPGTNGFALGDWFKGRQTLHTDRVAEIEGAKAGTVDDRKAVMKDLIAADAKRWNFNVDMLSFASIYRYTADGLGYFATGQIIPGIVSLTHGVVMNSAWLIAQRGTRPLPFLPNKRIFGIPFDSIPDKYRTIPFDRIPERWRNGMRLAAMVSGFVTPIVILLTPSEGGSGTPNLNPTQPGQGGQPSGAPSGGTTTRPSVTPTTGPSGAPTTRPSPGSSPSGGQQPSPSGPGVVSPSRPGQPRAVVVGVYGKDPVSVTTLDGIAKANLVVVLSNLSDAQLENIRQSGLSIDTQIADYAQPLLVRLNTQYPSLQSDPDLVIPGWTIHLEPPATAQNHRPIPG